MLICPGLFCRVLFGPGLFCRGLFCRGLFWRGYFVRAILTGSQKKHKVLPEKIFFFQ